MTKIIKTKDRQEWLNAREDGIGSSDIATIVGLNPYETPYQLYRRKRGMDAPKTETFAMRAGHYLEDAVSRFYSDESGRSIIKSSAGDWIAYDEKRPHLRVSPDRLYLREGHSNSKANRGILECKTTQKIIDPDDLPQQWICQLQYQLGVMGLQYGSLAWLTAGRNFGYKDLEFVPDFYAWLTEEATTFYEKNIKGGIEPEIANVNDAILKYARHTDGKTIEIDDDMFDIINELKSVKEQLQTVEEKKYELESRVKMLFADAEALVYDGEIIATWKAPKPSVRFNDKLFRKEHPELATSYLYETQNARRLLIK